MSRLFYLDKGLSLTHSSLAKVIAKVPASRFDESLEPGRFTLRQAIAHLADLEPVFVERMSLALSSPGAPVEGWDEDAHLRMNGNYASWDVQKSLAKFGEERAKTLALFNALSNEQARLSVKHPALGELSIEDLAVFALGHDAYHLEQVSGYL